MKTEQLGWGESDDLQAQAGEGELQTVIQDLQDFAVELASSPRPNVDAERVTEFLESQLSILQQVQKSLRSTHELSGQRYSDLYSDDR